MPPLPHPISLRRDQGRSPNLDSFRAAAQEAGPSGHLKLSAMENGSAGVRPGSHRGPLKRIFEWVQHVAHLDHSAQRRNEAAIKAFKQVLVQEKGCREVSVDRAMVRIGLTNGNGRYNNLTQALLNQTIITATLEDQSLNRDERTAFIAELRVKMGLGAPEVERLLTGVERELKTQHRLGATECLRFTDQIKDDIRCQFQIGRDIPGVLDDLVPGGGILGVDQDASSIAAEESLVGDEDLEEEAALEEEVGNDPTGNDRPQDASVERMAFYRELCNEYSITSLELSQYLQRLYAAADHVLGAPFTPNTPLTAEAKRLIRTSIMDAVRFDRRVAAEEAPDSSVESEISEVDQDALLITLPNDPESAACAEFLIENASLFQDVIKKGFTVEQVLDELNRNHDLLTENEAARLPVSAIEHASFFVKNASFLKHLRDEGVLLQQILETINRLDRSDIDPNSDVDLLALEEKLAIIEDILGDWHAEDYDKYFTLVGELRAEGLIAGGMDAEALYKNLREVAGLRQAVEWNLPGRAPLPPEPELHLADEFGEQVKGYLRAQYDAVMPEGLDLRQLDLSERKFVLELASFMDELKEEGLIRQNADRTVIYNEVKALSSRMNPELGPHIDDDVKSAYKTELRKLKDAEAGNAALRNGEDETPSSFI